jgi:hypothetical protein
MHSKLLTVHLCPHLALHNSSMFQVILDGRLLEQLCYVGFLEDFVFPARKIYT